MVILDRAYATKDVGQPLAEKLLTDSLAASVRDILPAGRGRTLFHLQEVELGTGRPDSILVVASLSALSARRRHRLRLPTLAHARVLGALRAHRPIPYSCGHSLTLIKSLQELGWLNSERKLRSVPRLVHTSEVIEAKLTDWRTGLCQLSKARWAANRASLLIPFSVHRRIPRRALRQNCVGLLTEDDGVIQQRIKPPTMPLLWHADAWLSELTIRHIERK